MRQSMRFDACSVQAVKHLEPMRLEFAACGLVNSVSVKL